MTHSVPDSIARGGEEGVRNEAEREQVHLSIGPVWDGNEVWCWRPAGAWPSAEAGAMMIDEKRRMALTAGFFLRWNSKLSCGIGYVAMELLAGVCDPGPSSLSTHS